MESSTLDNAVATVKGRADNLVVQGQGLLDRVISPDQRASVYERVQTFASAHPIVSTFLASQLALSGLPLIIFISFSLSVLGFSLIVGLLIGLLGAIALTGFAVGLALLFLLPTLFVTTTIATFIFFWGITGFYILQWYNGGNSVNKRHTANSKINGTTNGEHQALPETPEKQQRAIDGSKSPNTPNGVSRSGPVRQQIIRIESGHDVLGGEKLTRPPFPDDERLTNGSNDTSEPEHAAPRKVKTLPSTSPTRNPNSPARNQQ